MAIRAVLVDVYETALTCDFTAQDEVLPARAGVAVGVWRRESARLSPLVSDGRLTLTEAFSEVMLSAGVEPAPDVLEDLLRLDRNLLFAAASLYPDTVPFLQDMRSRGVRTAFVSNCAENTRPLLEHLGLAEKVDAIVLSCEVGASKPAAAVYQRALEALSVSADLALLVDDQESYCAGAVALGLRAVRISRKGTRTPGGVEHLAEVPALL